MISNYLYNRFQYVHYNNESSSRQKIVCGVPQGSILGPLLFLLYMSDMAYASKLLKCILFADDTNVTCSGKSINEVNRVMNNELMYLSDWCKVNKLSLNVEKTNCNGIS